MRYCIVLLLCANLCLAEEGKATNVSSSLNTTSPNCEQDGGCDTPTLTPKAEVPCKSILEEDDNSTVVCAVATPSSVPVAPPWTKGRLNEEQYNLANRICSYAFSVLIVSAVTLNVFNIIVYRDPSMRSPTSTYLVALSANELCVALFSLVRAILKSIYGDNAVRSRGYLWFIMYLNNPYKASLRRLMYCISVLVSTERLLAVAFPLKARNFRLIKSPIIFIVSVTVICLACHTPAAFKYDVVPKPNSTEYILSPMAFYKMTGDFLIYLSLANKIIYTYTLLIIGITVNICVLVALNIHSKNRKLMNTTVDEQKTAQRERQTTIAILTSSFLFTALALPLATDSVVSSFLPEYNLYKREHYVVLLMKEVNEVLIQLSLSTDFIFYMWLSKAYRRTFFKRLPFMAVICRRKKEKKMDVPVTKMFSVTDSNDD